MERNKIQFLLLLLTSAAGQEKYVQRITCDGVVFNHVYYDKHILVSNFGRPYNLVMHKFSGILFFSHTIQSVTQVDFGIIACHIEKSNCIEVTGINGGYAIGYDSGNDDIYLGGHEGLYKYNFLTKSAEYFAEEGKSIWGIFIRRNFYYIQYPNQKLYVYQEDRFLQVAEAMKIEIDHFFISKHGDIYFSNKTALYKVEKSRKSAIVLNDDIIIRQIVEDGYGDVYISASDGIYIEDKPYNRVKNIARIDQSFGLAFDEHDAVIFSDENAIYKLVQSNHSHLCYNAIAAQNKKDV